MQPADAEAQGLAGGLASAGGVSTDTASGGRDQGRDRADWAEDTAVKGQQEIEIETAGTAHRNYTAGCWAEGGPGL